MASTSSSPPIPVAGSPENRESEDAEQQQQQRHEAHQQDVGGGADDKSSKSSDTEVDGKNSARDDISFTSVSSNDAKEDAYLDGSGVESSTSAARELRQGSRSSEERVKEGKFNVRKRDLTSRSSSSRRKSSEPIPFKKNQLRVSEEYEDEETDVDEDQMDMGECRLVPAAFKGKRDEERLLCSSAKDKDSSSQFETYVTRGGSNEKAYHLIWNNHQSHILHAFETLLQNETFCDVTLVCDNDEEDEQETVGSGDNDSDATMLRLKAHKLVLSACSDYFQRIFAENPCKHPVIVLKDYQGWEIQALLDFMYKGEVDVSVERLPALIKSAESLQIRGLLECIRKSVTGDELEKVSAKMYRESNKPGSSNNFEALNLSLDLSISTKRGSDEMMIDMNDQPQNLAKETSKQPMQTDKITSNRHNLLQAEELEINQQEYEGYTSRQTNAGSNSTLIPRRKQARPRRRSGDFIAQDLRKSLYNNHIDNEDMEGDFGDSGINFELLNRHLREGEENGGLEIKRKSRIKEELDSQQSPSRPSNANLEQADEDVVVAEDGEGRAGTLMTRLASRRRSSRRLNHERDLHLRSAMSLRDNMRRGNSNNNVDDNNGNESLIDEEQNRVLDYTTAVSSAGNHNKKLHHKIRNNASGISFPGHLPFLRNWSPNSMPNSAAALHAGLQRVSPGKGDGDSDDGISSSADACQSPPMSPDPKPFIPHSRHPAHDFPLFGIHGDPQSLARNLPSSLSFTKQSPPSPSNFFMGSMGSMSITPIGASAGDESGADTPSTPPHVFSPAAFPMQLPLSNNHNHHPTKDESHSTANNCTDRAGATSASGRSSSSKHQQQQDGTRGSPVGWPGLPGLGPPPIFGRHRAQHSAPRGGPPRAWSNADLTEALHNVWNKKMTTSQASRIFGIPYNSLLMYVRGKYGKSLKLDLLKKGLDQALENSQNRNSSSPNGGGNTNSQNQSANASNTPANSNSNGATTSPTSTMHNNNNNNSSPLAKGHNEHNNNNPTTTGMGHLHQHHSHHHKSSKSAHHHGPTGIEIPHDLPPGFNPFTAASIFGEYPNPFPFASALSHILPQAGLVSQQQHGHPHLALSLPRNDKVSVGDDDK